MYRTFKYLICFQALSRAHIFNTEFKAFQGFLKHCVSRGRTVSYNALVAKTSVNRCYDVTPDSKKHWRSLTAGHRQVPELAQPLAAASASLP